MEVILLVLLIAVLLLQILILCLRFRGGQGKDAVLEDLKLKMDHQENRMEILHSDLNRAELSLRAESAQNREELNRTLMDSRAELSNLFKGLTETTGKALDAFSVRLGETTARQEEKALKLNETLRTSLEQFREKTQLAQQQAREELLKMQTQLNSVVDARLNAIRDTVDGKLKSIQTDNAEKLELMRKTVDEKLHESLEKRFNESFKLIGERLEQVHKGLGEMQTLANGVGDLKKVLSNVKTRGNLGEIQLASVLEQYLSPDQYVLNAAIKQGSSERVEFAVKMPGRNHSSAPVLLPIDSKFPVEDYQRLLDAYENAAPEELKAAQKAFESAVKKCASDIHSKYIDPPATTEFALMFVPTEGLYAEILRRPGLFELLQREYKISVVGPANLVAFLNSLQMGFRTLAIEKRSSEVWAILGAVKTEFGRFGDILDKTRNKLESAVKEIDSAGVRTRAIERKLRDVQELPAEDALFLQEGKQGE